MQEIVIPFHIVIGARAPQGYPLRATCGGRSAEETMPPLVLTRPPAEASVELGEWLLPASIRRLLIEAAREAAEHGARMQLRLEVAAPELAALPWEWLALSSGEQRWQPAIRDDYPLVRISARALRPLPPRRVSGPLRMLIAVARGQEAVADALGEALIEPVRAGRLVVDRLRDATADEVVAELAAEPRHILHIIGDLEQPPRQAPRIRLGRAVSAGELAELLLGIDELRLLAVSGAPLETCIAFAAALHEADGRAVAALPALSAAAQARWSAACYQALAAGEPVDIAMTMGRAALAQAHEPWGAPQLYLAPGGEQLFRPGEPPIAPAPPEAARPLRQTAPAQRPRFAPTSTTVGAPTKRLQDLTRQFRLQPQLVALIIASLVLIVLVSQVINLPGSSATPTPVVTPTPPLLLDPIRIPVPTLFPTSAP
ncbi:polysaccharide deacetylase [Chloroflexus sp.]|uniref:polysaccharide deacetylase n=1 Tax=Chloroflexus sp. TaxID=1904827 RepID=UPI00298EFE25|nr:polysaccharide deacetylase [Chloroflexus sp.]MDW8405542.1 polysaccharide deacetylase [Chloroflexus sp.]